MTRRVVLGVTSSASLALLRGFPEYLAAQGWDVHVVANGWPATPSEDVTYHVIPMRREISPLRDVVGLLRWARLLRRLRPRVVCTGTPKAGLLGMSAGWLTRVPVRVYKLRGLRLETAEGWRRLVLWFAERTTTAAACRVIAVSPSLARRAVALRLVRQSRVVIFGYGSSNGVDVDAFRPAEPRERAAARRAFGLPEDVVAVGFVGRLTEDKGILDLLSAHAQLIDRGLRIDLVLAGEPEEASVSAALDERREACGGVHILGHQDEIVEIYRAIDVLCLPTFREGFPNVVLEAGAMGLPTVTTRATGAIDSVIDGCTGLLVGVRDVAALASALEALALDGQQRARLGTAARAHVVSNFSQPAKWQAEADFFDNWQPAQ